MRDWSIEEQTKFMEYHRDERRQSLRKMKTVAYRGAIEARRVYMRDHAAGIEKWHRDRLHETDARLKAIRDRREAT